MKSQRNLVLETLNDAFKKNVKLQEMCISISHSKISSGSTNRVFDDFPVMLPSDVFNSFTNQFKQVLLNITHVSKTDSGYTLTKRKDKIALVKLQKKIIDIACRDMLNPDGTINIHFINLLGWQPIKNKIDNVDLLCAFVGATNLAMMRQFEAQIKKHEINYHAICTYLNAYYRTWIIETLQSLDIPYDRSQDRFIHHDESLDALLTTNEKIAVGATAGAAILGGLAILGYALFASGKAPHIDTLDFNPPTPPPSP